MRASILVVDDDEVDRELVERCLRELEDVEVRFATDGEEALAGIAARAPDIVLTDLRMPRLDGLELVQRIGADYPLVPVILMTSQGNEQTAVAALEAGASSYVPKRQLVESLVDTVERVLEVAASRRSRHHALRYLERAETRFELVNDPTLIVPVIGYFQESLRRLGFHSETERMKVGTALMEALSNAMVHGNLELDSDLRRTDRSAYDRLLQERQRQQPYADRRVHITAVESTERVDYVVEDEGPGFDPTSLPDPTAPEHLLDVAGRGIMLIRTFMDEVHFNERGNRITLSKLNPVSPGSSPS